MLKITYIAHSSFFIETDRTCLLFDYYTGTIPKVPVGKKLYVFASHRHGDHYSKKIFDLKNEYKDVHYLLSSDIEKIEDDSISYLKDNIVYFDSNIEVSTYLSNNKHVRSVSKKIFDLKNEYKDVHYLLSSDIEKIEDDSISYLKDNIVCFDSNIEVSTYLSNDEGIAFMVKVDGYTLYHAGDLNNWDWIGEDKEWLDWQKNLYHAELEKMKDFDIDVAFIPLDPRLEDNYHEGITDFLKVCHTRYIVPMHCWNKYDVIERFIEEQGHKDQVLSFTQEGEVMDVKI